MVSGGLGWTDIGDPAVIGTFVFVIIIVVVRVVVVVGGVVGDGDGSDKSESNRILN